VARSCVRFRLGEHDDLDNWHGIAVVDQLPGQPQEFLKIFIGDLLGPGFKPLVEEVGARTAKKTNCETHRTIQSHPARRDPGLRE
jgi:hypothetical protein